MHAQAGTSVSASLPNCTPPLLGAPSPPTHPPAFKRVALAVTGAGLEDDAAGLFHDDVGRCGVPLAGRGQPRVDVRHSLGDLWLGARHVDCDVRDLYDVEMAGSFVRKLRSPLALP